MAFTLGCEACALRLHIITPLADLDPEDLRIVAQAARALHRGDHAPQWACWGGATGREMPVQFREALLV